VLAVGRSQSELAGYGWIRLEPGWRSLPFASVAFGVVVAASVLEYVAEPAAVSLAADGVRSPPRLLAFRRADERADEPLAPHADESGAQQGTRE
jgi:hypothetical protein